MRVTVLVDARNVLRSTWPNIPEEELVQRCRVWVAERGFTAVLVFDGKAPGDAVGERALDDAVSVVGTGSETADAWLERAAARLDRGRPFWLVTSDRALRQAAGAGAERIVGGGTFARELPPITV